MADKLRCELYELRKKYNNKYSERKNLKRKDSEARLSPARARIFFEFCEESLGLSEHQANRMLRVAEFLEAKVEEMTPDIKAQFVENRHMLDDSILDELQKLGKMENVTISANSDGHLVVNSLKGPLSVEDATVEELRDLRREIAGRPARATAEEALHDANPDLWVEGTASNKPFTYLDGKACTNGSRQTRVVGVNVTPKPKVQGDNLAFSPGKEDIDAFVTLKGGDGVVIRWYCAAEKRWYQGTAVATAGGTQS